MTSPPERLPHGRHGLSREEVERSQRDRLLKAAADAMSEKGYARTVVADIIKLAGVSRETFYRMYSSKLDCFLAAYRRAMELLLGRLQETGVPGVSLEGYTATPVDDSMASFSTLYEAYLDALASHPNFARLFLVEVQAAGQEAIELRLQQHQLFVDAISTIFDIETDSGRFACRTVVAATAQMVAAELVSGDMDALRAIGPPMIEHVRTLYNAGVLV